jgi:uncharacterized protein (DUF302 family)
MTDTGLITVPSRHSVKETIDRLAQAMTASGVTIFARIDHGAGAAAAALPLRPTELLIFGQARAGTPLMQANQTAGIDLPLKALAWEDAEGRVSIAYNDPAWLARRHALGGTVDAVVARMSATLAQAVSRAAD